MLKKNLAALMAATVVIALSGLMLTGCEPPMKASEVAFAEPIMDNILNSMEAHDYQKFSADLSDAMKEAVEKIGFETMIIGLEESLGAYQGRQFEKAIKAKAKNMNLVIITYRGQFAKNDKAVITVYISDLDGVKKVEGFAAAPSGSAQ
jgi:L-lactate utilization protein LutC